ncbi:hypothetical protein RI367_003250 [Sorochytrium milnesiophthora]
MSAAVAATIPFPQLYTSLEGWSTPLTIALSYASVVTLWNSASGQKTPSWTKTSAFTAFVFLHNVLLAVFSALTFVNVVPQFASYLRSRPLRDAWCDRDAKFWDSTLFYWTWLFYLSKYYEIMDTIIILLKGKRSSLLQTYHHIGAILCMHVSTYSKAAPIVLFVSFNSLIHTLMYTYYAMTTVNIRPPVFLKKSLTKLQITQFLVGMTAASSFLIIEFLLPAPKTSTTVASGAVAVDAAETSSSNATSSPSSSSYTCLKDESNVFAVWFNLAYLVPLTYLFFDFLWKTYTKSGRTSAAATAAAAAKKSQ